MNEETLGKLTATHNISPVYTQRAFIVGGLALLFFAAMLFAFSIRQNIIYLLLGIAFLFVEVITLISWVLHRRTPLKIFENGFVYKKQVLHWDEISSVSLDKERDYMGKPKITLSIEKKSGEKIFLSDALEKIEQFAQRIEQKTGKQT